MKDPLCLPDASGQSAKIQEAGSKIYTRIFVLKLQTLHVLSISKSLLWTAKMVLGRWLKKYFPSEIILSPTCFYGPVLFLIIYQILFQELREVLETLPDSYSVTKSLHCQNINYRARFIPTMYLD